MTSTFSSLQTTKNMQWDQSKHIFYTKMQILVNLFFKWWTNCLHCSLITIMFTCIIFMDFFQTLGCVWWWIAFSAIMFWWYKMTFTSKFKMHFKKYYYYFPFKDIDIRRLSLIYFTISPKLKKKDNKRSKIHSNICF